jgi:hypothetical protein
MAFAESRLRYDDKTITRSPDLVRWGPVIAGVIIGLGFFALLNSLWFAIAYTAGGGWVGSNLAWFVGITAAASLLIAGWVAGALAGVRGILAGLVNGVTAWALLFVLSLTVISGVVNVMGTRVQQEGSFDAGAGLTAESALWTGFWSLLVGLALAAAGGILGGRMRRPVVTAEDQSAGQPQATTVPTAPRRPAEG